MLSDARLTTLFATLERDLVPASPTFEDGLLDRLRSEAAFGGGPVARFRRRLRRQPQLRLLLVAATLLALLVAAAIAGQLLQPPSVEEILQRSMATYEDPPLFEMTARFASGNQVARIQSDGDAVRWELLEGNAWGIEPGSYVITASDGRRGGYMSHEQAWQDWDGSWPLASDLNVLSWLARSDVGEVTAGPDRTLETCDAWTSGGQGTVAGRPTDIVACDERRWWVDRETGLVLRYAFGDRVKGEVETLDLAPEIEAALMAFPSPAPEPSVAGVDPEVVAAWLDRPHPNHVLEVGSTLPPGTIPLLDGTALDIEDLAGRPTIIDWWSPTERCWNCRGRARLVDGLAREYGNRLRVIHFALPEADPSEVEATARAEALTSPVALDSQGLWHIWGFEGSFGSYLFLDAEGRVAATINWEPPTAELERMAAELVAGEPVRPPDWPPQGRRAQPLGVGEPLPTFTGRTLAGDPFTSADIAGSGVVIVYNSVGPDMGLSIEPDEFGPGEFVDPAYVALWRELTAEVRRRGDVVTLVLAVSHTPDRDYLERFFAEFGAPSLVVFDEDPDASSIGWQLGVNGGTMIRVGPDGVVTGIDALDALGAPNEVKVDIPGLLDELQPPH